MTEHYETPRAAKESLDELKKRMTLPELLFMLAYEEIKDREQDHLLYGDGKGGFDKPKLPKGRKQ